MLRLFKAKNKTKIVLPKKLEFFNTYKVPIKFSLNKIEAFKKLRKWQKKHITI